MKFLYEPGIGLMPTGIRYHVEQEHPLEVRRREFNRLLVGLAYRKAKSTPRERRLKLDYHLLPSARCLAGNGYCDNPQLGPWHNDGLDSCVNERGAKVERSSLSECAEFMLQKDFLGLDGRRRITAWPDPDPDGDEEHDNPQNLDDPERRYFKFGYDEAVKRAFLITGGWSPQRLPTGKPNGRRAAGLMGRQLADELQSYGLLPRIGAPEGLRSAIRAGRHRTPAQWSQINELCFFIVEKTPNVQALSHLVRCSPDTIYRFGKRGEAMIAERLANLEKSNAGLLRQMTEANDRLQLLIDLNRADMAAEAESFLREEAA